MIFSYITRHSTKRLGLHKPTNIATPGGGVAQGLVDKMIKRVTLAVVMMMVLGNLLANTRVQARTVMIEDRVVAVINDTPILDSEVRSKVRSGPLVMVSEYPSSSEDTPYQKALNDAINLTLVEEKSAELDIEVSEEELDQQIEGVLQQQNATREQLLNFLESQGLEWQDYRTDMHHQILVQKFRGRWLAPRIRITQRRIKDHYRVTYKRSPEDTRLSVWQITAPDRTVGYAWHDRHMGRSLSPQQWQELQTEATGGALDMGQLNLRDLASDLRAGFEEITLGALSKPVFLGGQWRLFFISELQSTETSHFQAHASELQWQLHRQQSDHELLDWLVRQRKQHPQAILSPI